MDDPARPDDLVHGRISQRRDGVTCLPQGTHRRTSADEGHLAEGHTAALGGVGR